MKAIQLKSLLGLVLLALTLQGCVQDDDFKTPDVSITEPELSGPVITIDAVAGFLAQEQGGGDLDYTDEESTFTFEETNSYMSGYVISSDLAGNFFEEILLQDKIENPTIGIKVLIDVNPLFTRYEMGRKIYIKLDGLSAGITNGVLTIGALNGLEVDKIPAPLEEDYIVRSTEKAELVPYPIDLNNLQDGMTNLYVQLNDVQFQRNQVIIDNPLTFAAEPTDEFDGERILEDCANGGSVIFSTSTFADFKGLQLPVNRGSMNAILSKNFFGDTFNIVVNSASDIIFDNAERCDPDFLICETAGGGGSVFWEEDFEGFSGYVSEGWTNENVGGGIEDWVVGSFSGNAYAQISGFNSGEDPIDVWLITPAINLDSTTGEELSFDVQTNFNNGDILSVWVSTNFSGDPTTADWTPLDAIIPEGSSSGFGSFEPVGPINISCLDGDIHVGFFYQGADPGPTTRYHVDNVEVTGN
ncbi:MAG: hypothetical protein HKO96_06950 [Flavobacteriaceae bacterium]|nr:choice-of-anchor J domain-containing protein [Bacteroidia bacterium]NNK70199.1 hypothetical protein [Flavobacteriaceae bacterium]NNL81143.1 hypothetical protein [Flavobacteriaceae bacterium]